ncbi:MAG: lysylphosphatidylglycerol synthase transmembrane domain-containing protein [Candidatus Nanopelagicales bacterium]|nr:lysylphosphatidylglycerol synthase transmembrane domain-containing protein [Candidatus Nanopelagicales bacterium]
MSTPAPSAQIDKKKSLILGLIGLIFIVIIFVRVIPQIMGDEGYAGVADSLRKMGWGPLIVVGIFVVIYLITYGFPFKAATPGLKFWPSEQINQAAFAISNGIPGGGAVGLAFQYGMLSTYNVPPAAATSAITAVGIWSSFISLGFPILGVVALVIGGENGSDYIWYAVVGLVVLIAVLVGFTLLMRSEKAARWIGGAGNAILKPFRGRIKKLKDLDLVSPLVSFRSNMYDVLKRRWAALTVAQIAVSFTQFLILYVALRGLQGWENPGTSFLLVFAAFAISQIGMMIPITPGGLGTVDAVMISLLTAFGVDSTLAGTADLVWRFTSYVPQMAIGIIALVAWTKKAGQKFATTSAPAA